MEKGKKLIPTNIMYQISNNKSLLSNSKPKKSSLKKKSTRFDFLYENSNIIRKKIELERLIKQYKAKKIMYPEMLINSKMILNKKLSQNLEHEELIDENNLLNKSKNKNNKKPFTFKPLLCKKSIIIAESLPINLKERLESLSKFEEIKRNKIIEERKKKNEEMNNKDKTNFSYYKLIKENKRCNNLYYKALNSIKDKEYKAREAEKEKDNFYKQFPYKPELYNNTNLSYENNNSKSFDIYTRNNIWKDNINNKTIRLRELKYKKEKSNYTFNPKINNSIMHLDSSFIKSNFSEYLLFIHKFNEKEKYKYLKNKKNNKIRNVTLKNPKKIFINYEDEKNLNSSLMNKYKLNRIRVNSINDIEKQRNLLGTSRFFTDYIFLKKNNSIYSSYLENNLNYNKLFFKTRNYSFSFSDAVKKVLKQV